jgi:signal peptidase II
LFQILFIENPGMAFGMESGGSIGKYIITILRIVLVVVMFIYMRRLLNTDSQVPMGVCGGIMMVMVGALGQIGRASCRQR